MPREKSEPQAEQQDIAEQLERLGDELLVIRNVMDELHDTLQWITQNGIPRTDMPQHRLLKKMAANPCAEDWNERLEIVCENSETTSTHLPLPEPVSPPNEKNSESEIQKDDEWVIRVEKPVKAMSEGVRILHTKDLGAGAEYEIVPLPMGRWEMRTNLYYQFGDMRDDVTPWVEYATREEAVDQLVKQARKFFGEEIDARGNDLQRRSRVEMLKFFEDRLFGFEEPDVTYRLTNPELDEQSDS